MKWSTCSFLLLLILFVPPAHGLDLGSVPPDVALTISNMASRVLHSEEFSCEFTQTDEVWGTTLTISCPLTLVTNHLYVKKSTTFKYDPKKMLTNTNAPGYVSAVRQFYGGDVFMSTNGPWVRSGNIFQFREADTEYFYKDERSGHPSRLIRVYFPMDDATWAKICTFVDGARIQQVYNGKAYPIGVDDVRALGLRQTGIDEAYSLHTHRDELVEIDLRKRTYSVCVFPPR